MRISPLSLIIWNNPDGGRRNPIDGQRKPWGVDIGMRGICRTILTVRKPEPCALVVML